MEKALCLMCPNTTESTHWISSTSICQIAVCHSSGAVDSSLMGCDIVQIGKHMSRDEDEAAWTASADLLSGPLLQTTPRTSYTNCPRLLVFDTLPAAPEDGERRWEAYLTRWASESLRLARCRNVRRNSVLRVSEVQWRGCVASCNAREPYTAGPVRPKFPWFSSGYSKIRIKMLQSKAAFPM
jgi:hypothetical protein